MAGSPKIRMATTRYSRSKDDRPEETEREGKLTLQAKKLLHYIDIIIKLH